MMNTKFTFLATIILILLNSLSAKAQKSGTDSNDTEPELPEGFDLNNIPEFETKVKDSTISPSASSKTITEKQIEDAHPVSTDKLLQLVPGVEIVQHGSEGKGHQIMLRGFDAAHGSDVEITLESVPLNEPSHVHGQGYVDLYGIIPEVVTQMDVHMGPFLPAQGNFATAGSINFRLGVPADFNTLTLRTGIDNYGKFRGVTVFSPGKKDNFVAADIVHDPGFAKGREAGRGSLLAQYKNYLKNDMSWSILLSAQSARFDTPGTRKLSNVENGKINFYDVHHPYGTGLSDRVLGRAGFNIDRPKTKLDTFIYGMARDFALEENFTGALYSPQNGDRKRQEQQGGVAGASLRLDQKIPTPFKSSFTAGAGWRFDGFNQTDSQVTSNGTPWRINRSNKMNLNNLYLFTGIKISPWKWIDVYPSVRFDTAIYSVKDNETKKNKSDNFNVISPRVALAFPVNEKVSFFADWGQGFRFPEARSILYSGDTSDKDLKLYEGGTPDPSKCNTVEAGTAISPLNWINVKLTGFGVWMEREMLFDHVSNITLEMDGTTRLGGEFDIALKPLEWIRIDANITYARAVFNHSGNPVPNIPSLMGTGTIKAGRESGSHGGFDILWMGKHNLAHGASITGYAKLGIDGGYRFKKFDVTAIIDNLLNSKITEGTYHFASWFDRSTPASKIPEIQYVAGNPFTLRLLFTVFL